MKNSIISFNTQQLIAKERERIVDNVVRAIGRISDEVIENIAPASGNAVENTINVECEQGKSDIMEMVNNAVETALGNRFKSLLHDIDYRINTLYNVLERAETPGDNHKKVNSRDLNISQHILDGFVFEDDAPTAGSVSWNDCHIVYKGQNYDIADGDTTDKYVFWKLITPTTFQTSNTKPALGADDVLVGVNEGGTFHCMLTPGKMTPGSVLLDGTVGSDEIGSGAVTSGKIASGAVRSENIADAAVVASKILDGAVGTGKLASGAVDSTKLASGAVTAGKIASGAINNANLFSSGVVNETALASGAVSAAKLADKAVTSAKLGDSAVTGAKIAAGAISGDKLADGAITGPKIGAGAIGESKLNLATHLLY